jgi:hypothetical protein
MKKLRGTLLTDKMKHNIEYTEKINKMTNRGEKPKKHSVPIGRCAVCFRTIFSDTASSYYEFKTSKRKSFKKCHDSCAKHRNLRGIPDYVVKRRKNKYKKNEE